MTPMVMRRLGQFVVGTFAGLCSTLVPRLSMMLGAPVSDGKIQLEVVTGSYVVAATVFAVAVGGVVLVFGWSKPVSPRQAFMSALGIPALLSGSLNSAAASNEAGRQAAAKNSISSELAKREGIEVVEEPTGPRHGPAGRIEWPGLLPVAFASSGLEDDQASALGVRFVETKYWIILSTSATQQEAENKLRELGQGHSELKVLKRADNSYSVVLDKEPMPYSVAVSKAIEAKRKGGGSAPKLLRAQ